MLLSPYATFADKVRMAVLLVWCGLVLAFLVLPIFVPVPLSVNAEAFFTYPLKGFSWRWYREVLGSGAWREAIWHSIVIAIGVTVLATSLGTLAAVGLSNPRMPARRIVMAVLISPLIVPVVITAVGAYLFYAPIGLANSFIGIIIAQTTIACAVRRRHRRREPRQFRSHADAGCGDFRRAAVRCVPSRDVAADPAWRAVRRRLRLRRLVRRAGDRAVPGRPRATHAADADVRWS